MTQNLPICFCFEDVRETAVRKVSSINNLGPVFQSVVSLTSSLRVISSTVLADSI